jgi:phosphoglycolate phosphatase-like HAD superfamily hydrolase
MIAERGPILILDLHNTLYDEVMEYGGAMNAAIEHFLGAAKRQGVAIDQPLMCRQLSEAHAHARSDWDDDVWSAIAELRKLSGLRDIIDQAVALRRKASEKLTGERAYRSTIEAVIGLKNSGAAVYVATEATENAAADAIAWLGLDGILDGVYAWPFRNRHETAGKTPIRRFPPDPRRPGSFVQKPHPLILGSIMLDAAKAERLVPRNVTLEEVYELTCEDGIRELENAMAVNAQTGGPGIQARDVMQAVHTKLAVRNGPYATTLEGLRQRCVYMGDSYFKDGLLAGNAGIPFVFARYGTVICDADRKLHDECRNRLFGVTGWNEHVIRLTHGDEKLLELTDKITPYFVCQESLRELVEFMNSAG